MVGLVAAGSPNYKVVSSLNASTAALTNATPFTGSWENALVGSLLTVVVASDADLDIQIQFSVNGTNID